MRRLETFFYVTLSAYLAQTARRPARAERKPNPNSTDLLLQGYGWSNEGQTPENLAKAREYFQRALDPDPNNLTALIEIADVDLTTVANYQAVDWVAKLASAEAAAAKVLASRPDDAGAHRLLGAVEIQTNRGAEGIAQLKRAAALDPNSPYAHASLGFAMMIKGRADEVDPHFKEAFRLSPRDPFAFAWVAAEAAAKLYSGADEEAAAISRRSPPQVADFCTPLHTNTLWRSGIADAVCPGRAQPRSCHRTPLTGQITPLLWRNPSF